MGWRWHQVFDKIIVLDTSSLDTAATPFLGPEFILTQTLDVALVGKGDEDIWFLNQVFILQGQDFSDHELCSAFVSIFALDFGQLLFDNLNNPFWLGQNIR